METNRTRCEHLDEAWISKYRAAMDTPASQSRLKRMRTFLARARQDLASQIEVIVGVWTKGKKAKLFSANELAAVSARRVQARSVKGVELDERSGVQEEVAKPKPARPLPPSQKYRAG